MKNIKKWEILKKYIKEKKEWCKQWQENFIKLKNYETAYGYQTRITQLEMIQKTMEDLDNLEKQVKICNKK